MWAQVCFPSINVATVTNVASDLGVLTSRADINSKDGTGGWGDSCELTYAP